MSKQVYISADYSDESGDRDVVEILNQWGSDNVHKVAFTSAPTDNNIGNINSYSYLKHEFEQAQKRDKTIIVVYNSLRKEENWLPSYMKGYEIKAEPFWIKNAYGEKVGNYEYIKEVLGYA